MAVGDVYRATVRGFMGSDEWENVLHFQDRTGAGSDLGGLSDTIKTTIYDVVKTFCTPSWSLKDITIEQLVIGGGALHVSTYNMAGTDATAAGAGAKFNSMVAKLTTGLAGRSHRGRVYLPINAADQVPNGLFPNATVTAVGDAVQAMVPIYGPSGTDADWHWVVWSRKLGEILTGGHLTGYNFAAGAFVIAATSVDNVVRLQRRREVGKGA